MFQFRSLLLAAAIGAAISSLPAQTTATLSGVVSDKTGAGVPGAEVTISSPATGTERKTTTSETGDYRFSLLLPGDYRLIVMKTGFKEVVHENVRLEVNQAAVLDFALEVGQVTDKVTVTEQAPMLESSSSSMGQVIERKAIEDLPLNGRNFVQLAMLGPGVSGVGYSANGTIMSGTRPGRPAPGQRAFRQRQPRGVQQLLDGWRRQQRAPDAVHRAAPLGGSRSANSRFRPTCSPADQGRNSGATVNVITKSGTNEWHGSAVRVPAQRHLGRQELLHAGRAARSRNCARISSAAVSARR